MPAANVWANTSSFQGSRACGDLVHVSSVVNVFRETTAKWLLQVARGIDQSSESTSSKEENPDLQKSISIERTFSKMEEPVELFRMSESLSYDWVKQLHRKHAISRTFTIKLKSVDFKVTTRSITVYWCVQHPNEILDIVSQLLKKELPVQLRLFDLRASALVDEDHGSDELGRNLLQKEKILR